MPHEESKEATNNNNEARLRCKYVVYKAQGDTLSEPKASADPNNIDSPFVLMPRKDPAAFTALLVYTNYCEPQLAGEIRDWLRDIAKAPPRFGTQGTRNFVAVRENAVNEAYL